MWERLEIEDFTDEVTRAIARYSIDDISNGVGVFMGRKQNKKLPKDLNCESRYLLGIIRNLANSREGISIARALWDERVKARDCIFNEFRRQHAGISEDAPSCQGRLDKLGDQAVQSESAIERHYWLCAVVEEASAQHEIKLHECYERIARRIHTAYRIPYEERQQSTIFVAERLLPMS